MFPGPPSGKQGGDRFIVVFIVFLLGGPGGPTHFPILTYRCVCRCVCIIISSSHTLGRINGVTRIPRTTRTFFIITDSYRSPLWPQRGGPETYNYELLLK